MDRALLAWIVPLFPRAPRQVERSSAPERTAAEMRAAALAAKLRALGIDPDA